MRVGPNAEKLLAASKEMGTPLPRALQDVEFPADQFQWNILKAFWSLSRDRQVVMGAVGPIPWTAINIYIHEYGYDYDETARDDFEYLIQQLDEEFIEVKADQIKEEQKRGNPKGVSEANARPRGRTGRARR